LVITAILSVILGIFPDLFFKFYKLAANIAVSIIGAN